MCVDVFVVTEFFKFNEFHFILCFELYINCEDNFITLYYKNSQNLQIQHSEYEPFTKDSWTNPNPNV